MYIHIYRYIYIYVYMYIYIYIYIHICMLRLGWHYLSDATCLMRPRVFHYVCFVVSRITIMCCIIHHFEESLR